MSEKHESSLEDQEEDNDIVSKEFMSNGSNIGKNDQYLGRAGSMPVLNNNRFSIANNNQKLEELKQYYKNKVASKQENVIKGLKVEPIKGGKMPSHRIVIKLILKQLINLLLG